MVYRPPTKHSAWLCAACALCVAAPSFAEARQSADRPDVAGEVVFDCPFAPEPTVEVNLDADIVRDLLGIGEAALAGIVDALPALLSDGGPGTDELRMKAEHLDAVQRLITNANGVLRQCHVRVYDGDDDDAVTTRMVDYYSGRLESGGWDDVVRVRDGDETVRVSLLRESGTIHGILVMVSEPGEAVLVNVVCEISPDNVKQLVSTALEIATELGLQDELLDALN